jgi:hypothetical protein
VSEWHIRHAIKAGKVSRPALDGSHRFMFTPDHLAELKAHFGGAADVPVSGLRGLVPAGGVAEVSVGSFGL